MINVQFLLQDKTSIKVNQFFSGNPQIQKKLVDTDIVSIIFACRAINNLSAFEQICTWVGINRPNLLKKISRGVVIADKSLSGSPIDLSFKLYDMNDAERAFTLMSALDTQNTEVFDAIFDVLDNKMQLKIFELLVRALWFKYNNYSLLKVNGSALSTFINNIDFIERQMSKRKFQSILLRKTKSAAFSELKDFQAARASLQGLQDFEIPFLRLQIDYREACSTGNFRKAQKFGISMINSIVKVPALRSGFGKVEKFDTNACLVALRRTYEVLDVNGINPFLISGTLLGMVRDGKIFDHDKDFDLAVIGWEKQFDVFEVLYKSGEYDLDVRQLKGKETFSLSALHRNTGIVFDIFFMRPYQNKYLHGVNHELGFVVPFLFTTFDLIVEKFGDDFFRVPMQWKRNLSENYGEGWEFPDKGYDVLIESPAIYDKSSASFKILALDRVLSGIVRNDESGVRRKISFLQKHLDLEADEFSSFIIELSSKEHLLTV